MKYIKIILILFFIIPLCIVSSQNINNDKLHWDEDIKLKWSDFKCDTLSKELGLKKAEAATEISIKANYTDGDIPNFIVINSFIRNESWTITDKKHVLEHEQLHFDISELYTRKIRKRFKELSNASEKNSQIYIDQYYKFRDLENEYQKKYDSDVYFNDVKQQEWIDKISKELNELNDYEYSNDSPSSTRL